MTPRPKHLRRSKLAQAEVVLYRFWDGYSSSRDYALREHRWTPDTDRYFKERCWNRAVGWRARWYAAWAEPLDERTRLVSEALEQIAFYARAPVPSTPDDPVLDAAVEAVLRYADYIGPEWRTRMTAIMRGVYRERMKSAYPNTLFALREMAIEAGEEPPTSL
jgi:hypothetical protein